MTMKNNLNKVIITGGAGFIGSNLVKKLLENGTEKILIIDDINDSGATFKYIIDNFGKQEDRIKFAALINNKPSSVKVDYHGYELNKVEVPSWIVFPWEEWDK